MIIEGRDLPIQFEEGGIEYTAKFGRVKEPEVLHLRRNDHSESVVMVCGENLTELESLLAIALTLVRKMAND